MTGMEDVLAMIEDIVHAETGQHVFRSGWDGSFTPAAGTLAQALALAGFGSQHDAWADGHRTGWEDRDADVMSNWTPSGYTQDTINPHPAPKVSES